MIDRTRKVYFASCIGPLGPIGAYKIGCSYGHNARIAAVATCLPFTLQLEAVVPGGFFMEGAVHLHLRKHRISGEYFNINETTRNFVERAKTVGECFSFIRDSGVDVPAKSFDAFLHYHDVSLQDVAEMIERPIKTLEAILQSTKSRRLFAAAALIAASRGQSVRWPDDALNSLLGSRSPFVERRIAKLPAPANSSAA